MLLLSLNVNINSYLKLLENESLTEQRYYQEKIIYLSFFTSYLSIQEIKEKNYYI